VAAVPAVAAVAVATADAAKPSVVVEQVDVTRTIPARPDRCSFPLVVHVEGASRTTTFFDNGGNVDRVVTLLDSYSISFTNPANGKSVKTVLAGPFIVEPDGDGTVKVTIPGNDGHFTGPGEGVLWSNVGRIVYLASADDPFTPLEILSVSGNYDLDAGSQFPEICSALE
jgi:hypothetical protein